MCEEQGDGEGVDVTHLCHVVCEEQGDGEGVDVTHLCHVVCEQQGDGEGVDVVAEAQLDDVADAEDDGVSRRHVT